MKEEKAGKEGKKKHALKYAQSRSGSKRERFSFWCLYKMARVKSEKLESDHSKKVYQIEFNG